MNLTRLWTIARLELVQRVRTVSWYVLLGVFALLLIGATWLAYLSFAGQEQRGPGIYSTVVYITLLLVILLSPTLSGNSINGDRDAATLAPVQVTLATTAEILLGKFVAAWITGLAFVAVAAPFLVVATFGGGVQGATVLISLLVLVAEIGIIAAIGVALSGVIARPLFSVATTYLVVAALAIGTVIGFGLVGSSMTSEHTTMQRVAEYDDNGNPVCKDGTASCWENPSEIVCGEWETYEDTVMRFDRVWWLLSANPFVILADATPTQFDSYGNPEDMFGYLKLSVRQTQIPPELETRWDDCAPMVDDSRTAREVLEQTVPSWFVGLGVQVLLAIGFMVWAYTRTRTPARSLPPGTRIA